MPKVELDEAEYNRLMALHGVASKIVANPAARKQLEAAHKLVDPNVPTPTLDAERIQNEPLNALQKKYDDELAALRKEREDEKREATLAKLAADQERGFARLKAQHQYTDEGVDRIKKLMETKGLLDVEDARAIFERDNPPQIATPRGGLTGERWNFADSSQEADTNIKALIAGKGDDANADAAAMRMANATLLEMRGSR
jgi:ribosome assembly protein YihI (activator of Der GTPase)